MEQVQQQQKVFEVKPLTTGSGNNPSTNSQAIPKPLDTVPVPQSFMFPYHHGNNNQQSPPYPHEEEDMSREEEEVGGHTGLGEEHDGKGKPKFAGKCKVCGDDASGMYFGALVCVPCKVSDDRGMCRVKYLPFHKFAILMKKRIVS